MVEWNDGISADEVLLPYNDVERLHRCLWRATVQFLCRRRRKRKTQELRNEKERLFSSHYLIQLCARPASPPPSGKKYYFATVRGLAKSPPTVHSNCSEAVYFAARTLLLGDLRSTFLRSVVIFVKYRKASTRTILPNFIDNCRDSVVFAFWRPQQRRH